MPPSSRLEESPHPSGTWESVPSSNRLPLWNTYRRIPTPRAEAAMREVECQLKFIGTTVSQIKKQSLAQRKVVTSWTAWSSASPSPLCIMHTCTRIGMEGTRVRHFQRPYKQGTSREEGYSIQILSQSLPRLLRNRPRSSLRRERRTNPSATGDGDDEAGRNPCARYAD